MYAYEKARKSTALSSVGLNRCSNEALSPAIPAFHRSRLSYCSLVSHIIRPFALRAEENHEDNENRQVGVRLTITGCMIAHGSYNRAEVRVDDHREMFLSSSHEDSRVSVTRFSN